MGQQNKGLRVIPDATVAPPCHQESRPYFGRTAVGEEPWFPTGCAGLQPMRGGLLGLRLGSPPLGEVQVLRGRAPVPQVLPGTVRGAMHIRGETIQGHRFVVLGNSKIRENVFMFPAPTKTSREC